MFEGYGLEAIIETQNWIKLILIFMIFTNFIIIIGLRFQIKIANKIKSMFDIKNLKQEDLTKKSALLIVSHPEDILLFFSPTIRTIINKKMKLKILCFSSNKCESGFINETKNEEEEFERISKNLRLEENKLIKINFEENDNNKNIEKIEKEIEKYLEENDKKNNNDNNKIDVILNCDDFGCDNNIEHCLCYYGFEKYLKNHREEIKKKGTKIYLLDSFSCLSQFFLVIPFFSFYFKESGFVISNFVALNRMLNVLKIKMSFGKKIKFFLRGYSYLNSYTKVELK